MRRGALGLLLPALVLGAGAGVVPAAPAPFAASAEAGTGTAVFAGEDDSATVERLDLGAARRELRRGRIALPSPAGQSVEFEVEAVQVMEPALAARHPELRSYVGRPLDGREGSVAVSITPLGLSASVSGPEPWVVEPQGPDGGRRHLVARSSEVEADRVLPLGEPLTTDAGSRATSGSAGPQAPDVVQRRTFRLALVNDPTYADYFGTENVLAAKVALVTRINQIYNDDLAVRFLLVEGSEALNLDTAAVATGVDGPCGAAPCYEPASSFDDGMLDRCEVNTLGRTRLVLANLIGASAYDVGHLVLGVDGGGLAWLGTAGRDYSAGGCTGLNQPRGDVFHVDYVAHEIGHQLSAQHTFNGDGGFCAANGTGASVEPGSGSSVMAYAGICGADDLQPHTDPYFSHYSIGEMTGFMSVPGEDVVEVQQVSLKGFDEDGDSITLSLGDRSVTLTRGVDYTSQEVQAAIADLVGSPVRVTRWDYDPYLGQVSVTADAPGRPGDDGFQVIYASNRDPDTGGTHQDRPELTATGSDGVQAVVVEVARGGEPRSGGQVEPTDNHRPVVSSPRNRTIPIRTPFKLKGAASDADGDSLTYSWEQSDAGSGTALLSNAKVFGPLFRQFGDNAEVAGADALESPSPGQNAAPTTPVRWFPDLQQVVHGRTNAESGRCPRASRVSVPDRVLDCYSEYLPTESYRGAVGAGRRSMHFRLTARDGNPAGGGTAHDDVVLRIQRSAGPFLVRSQRTGRTERAGKRLGVRWSVNGTRDLARSVRIRLSTDDGATFPTVLAKRTRNDGKKVVRLPKGITADQAWVMVQARGNYFFDVSQKAFKIR